MLDRMRIQEIGTRPVLTRAYPASVITAEFAVTTDACVNPWFQTKPSVATTATTLGKTHIQRPKELIA